MLFSGIQLLRADLAVGGYAPIYNTDRLAQAHAGVSIRRRETLPMRHPPLSPRQAPRDPPMLFLNAPPHANLVYVSIPRCLATASDIPEELHIGKRLQDLHAMCIEFGRACLSLPWVEIRVA